MPLDGLPIRCGRTVRDAKFFSGLLDDGRQFAEVDVADLREEVVLNLVVETSAEPRQGPAAGAKVGGGPQLVGPRIDVEGFSFLGRLVIVFFHHVGGLEDDGQNEASSFFIATRSNSPLITLHGAPNFSGSK